MNRFSLYAPVVLGAFAIGLLIAVFVMIAPASKDQRWLVREVKGAEAEICGEIIGDPIKISDNLNVVFVGKTNNIPPDSPGVLGAVAGSNEIKLGDKVCLHTFQIVNRFDLLSIAVRQ